MSISPFSFRELGSGDVEIVAAAGPRPFLANTGRKNKEEAAPPPPPPPPTFSESEVKEAEREGFQKGFLEGIEEGKNQARSAQADVDAALTHTVTGFAAQMGPLFSIYRDMLKIQAEQMPKIAYAIAKKVAGNALQENALQTVEEMCLRCVRSMLHEPKLSITIHASLAKTLEEKIKAACATLHNPPEILITGDDGIALPNCRIDWKNGAMVRDTDTLWQQVEQVVAGMVASGAAEAETLCDNIEQHLQQPDPATNAGMTGE